jgi:hypothetical protein
MDIKEALGQLKEKDYTADKQPKLDAIKKLVGKVVTRAEVTAVMVAIAEASKGAEASAALTLTKAKQDLMGKNGIKPVEKSQEAIEKEREAKDRNELLESCETKIEAVRVEISDLEREKGSAQNKLDAKMKEVAFLKGERVKLKPVDSEWQAKKAYLDSQFKQSMEAHERREKILKGIDTTKLDPREPIDQAMAQRRGSRQSQRAVKI